jgi:putative transposase
MKLPAGVIFRFPVFKMCTAFQASASRNYEWRKHTPSSREKENERPLMQLRLLEVAARHRYGSPRMWSTLRARGCRINRKRVEKLMKTHGILARRHYRRVRTARSDLSLPEAANLPGQLFHFTEINQALVGDIIYILTREDWLYLVIIMDLCSRKIVG